MQSPPNNTPAISIQSTASENPKEKGANPMKRLLETPIGYKTSQRLTPIKFFTPSPNSKETLSDRFIPMRACANLYERFIAEEEEKRIPEEKKNSEQMETEENREQDNSGRAKEKAYSKLLKSHVLLSPGCSNDMESIRKNMGEKNLEDEDENNIDLQEEILKGEKFSSPCESKIPLNNSKNFFAFKSEQKKGTSLFLQNQLYSHSPIIKFEGGLLGTPPMPLISKRKFPKSPYKILDAPGLEDDYYINIVDWSSQDVLAVGLKNKLYALYGYGAKVTTLLSLPEEEQICAVGFSPNGHYLSAGLSTGITTIIDMLSGKIIRSYAGHKDRVAATSFCNNNIFTTGSRDHKVINRDIRHSTDSIMIYEGHKLEVCQVKWSFDGINLASGGNDNKVFIWNMHSNSPILKLAEHKAAVKAMAWNLQHPGILATGGGTADRTIKIWEALSGKCVRSVDTGSQVCNLMFSRTVNELVSTHGYSKNEINVWKYPSLSKMATLTGHTSRVLYLGMSSDRKSIVTGAGDETLRFWNLFPEDDDSISMKTHNGSVLFPSNMDLR